MTEVLKQALEALETECDIYCENNEDGAPEYLTKAITALRQAIEQASKQEPVAWMFQHEETGRMNYVSNDGINTPELFLKMNPRYVFVCALYTTPPQRQWVGLTNNDWNSTPYDTEFRAGAEWAEAKLKEKNT